MNENKIIQESISEIKQIMGILKSQNSSITGKIDSKKEKLEDAIDEGVRTYTLQTQQGHLDFYIKIIEFLYQKLSEPAPDKEFFFFVPLLRTLIEIYSRLLHFCFQTKNEQMTLAIVDILSTIAKMDNDAVSDDIATRYKQNYEQFKPFLDREKIDIPSDLKKLTNKWFNENTKYIYPPASHILEQKWSQESSPQISPSLKSGNGNPRYLYKVFSNWVHGNIMAKETYLREKFWAIQVASILSCQMAELVSIKTLNNSQRKDIANWLKKFATNYPKLLTVWKSSPAK